MYACINAAPVAQKVSKLKGRGKGQWSGKRDQGVSYCCRAAAAGVDNSRYPNPEGGVETGLIGREEAGVRAGKDRICSLLFCTGD